MWQSYQAQCNAIALCKKHFKDLEELLKYVEAFYCNTNSDTALEYALRTVLVIVRRNIESINDAAEKLEAIAYEYEEYLSEYTDIEPQYRGGLLDDIEKCLDIHRLTYRHFADVVQELVEKEKNNAEVR